MFLLAMLAQPGAAQSAKSPLLVLLGGDTKTWESACREHGWQFLEPSAQQGGDAPKSVDQRVKAMAADVEAAEKRLNADPDRVYLVAQGGASATLFYMASRLPDLWAAAAAVGGSPRAAIDTNRIFAANTTNLPVLWLFSNKDDEPLGKTLQSAGFNLEWRELLKATPSDIFAWLGKHQRDAAPTTADCETGSPLFAHCYWIEVTKFDPAEANDVLDSTRVPPLGSGAVLGIGPFGYAPTDPGPGVSVASLPEKYSGPLKVNDRIMELGGKQIKDATEYTQIMYHTSEEKPVVVMVHRGKEHMRIETKIEIAPRPEPVTARVRAQYLPDLQEVEVVSRAITQIKLTLPAAFLPAKINWNGTEVANATEAGCWLLDERKELLTAKRCQ
jgi:pimeloyl-ACP methyl ester carboxylesterase